MKSICYVRKPLCRRVYAYVNACVRACMCLRLCVCVCACACTLWCPRRGLPQARSAGRPSATRPCTPWVPRRPCSAATSGRRRTRPRGRGELPSLLWPASTLYSPNFLFTVQVLLLASFFFFTRGKARYFVFLFAWKHILRLGKKKR